MTAEPDSIRESFDAFMKEHGSMIYTLAVRLSGNPADGQDLAQETFVKAFENFTRFRADSDVRTWLYRICINAWKNRVRYEKRRFFWKHSSVEAWDEDDGPSPQFAAADQPLGAVLEGEDRAKVVQDALEKLNPADRAVIVLFDMEEATYQGISSLLDVPMGTVKSRLARARERLRIILSSRKKEL